MKAPSVRAETPMHSNLEELIKLLDSADSLVVKELDKTKASLKNLKNSNVYIEEKQRLNRAGTNKMKILQSIRSPLLTSKITVENLLFTDEP